MARLLTEQEVVEALKKLRGWRLEGTFIAKDYRFETFMDGVSFVNRVAEAAETMDHHPDIHLRYTDVGLRVQTHSEGGVTVRDVRLAEAIDRIH